MKSGGTWVKRLQRRLSSNGYTILDLSPDRMAAEKRRSRRVDRNRLARRVVTPAQIQSENSLFPDLAKRGRIVGWGWPKTKP